MVCVRGVVFAVVSLLVRELGEQVRVVLTFSAHGWRKGARGGRKGESRVSNVRLRGGGVGAIRESAEQERGGAPRAVGHVFVVRVMVWGLRWCKARGA